MKEGDTIGHWTIVKIGKEAIELYSYDHEIEKRHWLGADRDRRKRIDWMKVAIWLMEEEYKRGFANGRWEKEREIKQALGLEKGEQ